MRRRKHSCRNKYIYQAFIFLFHKALHPLSISLSFSMVQSSPSSDHCGVDMVVPSCDHCNTETVPPSRDHYCTKKIAPPSDHLHTKITYQRKLTGGGGHYATAPPPLSSLLSPPLYQERYILIFLLFNNNCTQQITSRVQYLVINCASSNLPKSNQQTQVRTHFNLIFTGFKIGTFKNYQS